MSDMKHGIKCDKCGVFIGHDDLLSGRAVHRMLTPSSDVSYESWESLCWKHNQTPPESAEVCEHPGCDYGWIQHADESKTWNRKCPTCKGTGKKPSSKEKFMVTSDKIKARVDSLGNAILREQGKLPPVIHASPGKSLEEVAFEGGEGSEEAYAIARLKADLADAIQEIALLKATIEERDKEISELKTEVSWKYETGYEQGQKDMDFQ